MNWVNSDWANLIFLIVVYGIPGAVIVYAIFQVGRYFKEKADTLK